MKKLASLLGLIVASSALIVAGVSKHEVHETKADYESYIRVDASFFTNWTDDAGIIGDRNTLFWNANSFQAMDTFYQGENKETWTGTLNSRPWKQHTQYIYFQLGGANNHVDYGDAAHLNIHYGSYQSSFYNDTFVENPMLMRAFKIPDSAYNALMENADDFDMWIEIVDYQYEDYGFVNFGYLNVNQTADQVGDAFRWYINNLTRTDTEYDKSKRKQILENYYLNESLKEYFLKPYESINDDFESNNDFINHWYFDWQYYNDATWDLHFDRAIGFDSYRPEDTNMPFNKTSNGFFRGWYQNNELGGFVGGDGPVYRFISRPFVVSGTGLVSIKMAGNASLQFIDTATRQDIVWEDLSNTSFNPSGDTSNLAVSDFNSVTMVRHVVNLEAYLGRTLQVAIADIKTENWGAMYADELVTNYNSYPGFKVDTFTQSHGGNTYNIYKPDIYVNSSLFNEETNKLGLRMVHEADVNKANDSAILNHVDNSPAKAAYEFLRRYYLALRSPNNEFNYSLVSNEVKEVLVNSYEELSYEARDIVKRSIDIKYNDTFVADWWVNAVDTSKQVSVEFSPLVYSYVKYIVSFEANGGIGSMANASDIEGNYTLPECTFTAQSGYQFAGWKVNGVGETLLEGELINVSEDVFLVAQWEEIPVTKYVVSFDSNGGSGSMNSEEVEEGETFVLPGNDFTAPSGYRFIGWYVGNDETLRQPGYEFIVEDDIVICAQWEAIPTYTVSFDSNGGSGSMESISAPENSLVTLPDNGFTPPQGKRFVCWKFGEENKQPGDEILVVSDTVIRAIWELIPVTSYTVSFRANGGSGSMPSLVKEEGTIYALPQNGFLAPEGKKFAGWKVGNDSTLRQPGYEITINSDVVVSAMWEHNPEVKYTISFDANGGTGTMSNVLVERGEQFVLPACSFVAPEGKQFDSWLIGGSVRYQPGDKITIVGNTIIKASWVNSSQENPKDDQSSEQSEEQESQGPVMDFFNKAKEAVLKVFNKIAEFFKNLFSGSMKQN